MQIVVYVPSLIPSTAPATAPTAIDDLGDEGLNLVRRGDLAGIKALIHTLLGINTVILVSLGQPGRGTWSCVISLLMTVA